MYIKIDEIEKFDELPDYYNFSKPYVIRDGCSNMPIFKQDSITEFFRDKLRNFSLEVEIYDTYRDMELTDVKKYERKKFNDASEHIINNKKPYNFIADIDIVSLLQHNDLKNFSLPIDTNRKNKGILLFFGNNSRSGAHIHTSDDYVLNQIYGKKTIYMFDYYDNPLECEGLFTCKSNFLKNNIIDVDHTKLKIYKVELSPGDTLIIPPWWWHAAKSDGLSLSITKTYTRTDKWFLIKCPHIGLIILREFVMSYVSDIINFFTRKDVLSLLIGTIIIVLSYVFLK